MNEIALRASVGVNRMVGLAITRVRGLTRNERGTVAETIVTTAILVLAAVVVFGLIFNALKGQGEKISDCISGINTSGTCSDFN